MQARAWWVGKRPELLEGWGMLKRTAIEGGEVFELADEFECSALRWLSHLPAAEPRVARSAVGHVERAGFGLRRQLPSNGATAMSSQCPFPPSSATPAKSAAAISLRPP